MLPQAGYHPHRVSVIFDSGLSLIAWGLLSHHVNIPEVSFIANFTIFQSKCYLERYYWGFSGQPRTHHDCTTAFFLLAYLILLKFKVSGLRCTAFEMTHLSRHAPSLFSPHLHTYSMVASIRVH